jgi:hypothetical protein
VLIHRRHVAGDPLRVLPDPDDVAAAAPLTHLTALIVRLRALLRDTAAVGAVLPTPTELASSLGRPDEVAWAGDVVTELARAVGASEPDVVLHIGAGDPGGSIPAICAHFDVGLLRPGGTGVAAVPGDRFADVPAVSGWLWTTTSDVPADIDPRRVTAAVHQLRARAVEGRPA